MLVRTHHERPHGYRPDGDSRGSAEDDRLDLPHVAADPHDRRLARGGRESERPTLPTAAGGTRGVHDDRSPLPQASRRLLRPHRRGGGRGVSRHRHRRVQVGSSGLHAPGLLDRRDSVGRRLRDVPQGRGETGGSGSGHRRGRPDEDPRPTVPAGVDQVSHRSDGLRLRKAEDRLLGLRGRRGRGRRQVLLGNPGDAGQGRRSALQHAQPPRIPAPLRGERARGREREDHRVPVHRHEGVGPESRRRADEDGPLASDRPSGRRRRRVHVDSVSESPSGVHPRRVSRWRSAGDLGRDTEELPEGRPTRDRKGYGRGFPDATGDR